MGMNLQKNVPEYRQKRENMLSYTITLKTSISTGMNKFMIEPDDQIRCWSGGDGLTKTAIQSTLQMQGFEPQIWLGRSGDVYPLGTVPYQRIIWVAEGTLTVNLPEQQQEFKLKRGDCLNLPANIPHLTVVGSEKLVCVEARRYQAAPSSKADVSTKELS